MSSLSSKSVASASGAVASAIASSACCWLPLLLMGIGLSAGGVSAWFERYRLIFLVLAGSLLALGFYSSYFSGRRCQSACGCDRLTTRMQRVSRTMLWISAVIVVGFAAFPKYIGAFIGNNDSSTDSAAGESVELRIDGMTCEACSIILQESLSGVPGVADARVSYSNGAATLVISPGSDFRPQAALDAIADAGYAGRVERVNRSGKSP